MQTREYKRCQEVQTYVWIEGGLMEKELLYGKGLPQPSSEMLELMRQMDNLTNLRLDGLALASMGPKKGGHVGDAEGRQS